MSTELEKGITLKVSEVPSFSPPGHSGATSWPLVGPKTTGNEFVDFHISELLPGSGTEPHTHPGSDHLYFFLSGRARAEVEGKFFDIEPGMCLYVRPGALHHMDVVGAEVLRVAVVTAPPPRAE